MTNDEEECRTPAQGTPVLDYRTPRTNVNVRRAGLSTGAGSLIGGGIIALISLVFGKHTAMPLFLPVGGIFAGVWWLVLRSPGGVARNFFIRLHLVVAAMVLTFTTLLIFARSGQADAGPKGLAYWTNINRGYRYNPLYALQPWPHVVRSAAWFVAALLIAWIADKRVRSDASKSAESSRP